MSSIVLELPGVFIDEVILDDLDLGVGASYFVLANRNPEPSETGVRTDEVIALDLMTDAGDSPAVATTQVYLSTDGGPEVLAYDGGAGGFQSGYGGPLSAVTSPDADTLRIVIDPVADFGSLQVVTVRVDATSTGAQEIDKPYSFTIEDATAPILVSATGREKSVVRLVFDEPINQGAATLDESALNPANYAFTRLSTPAVDIVASSVAVITSSEIDITLDTEQTPGATYLVVVTNVEDVLGNEIEAPNNQVEFLGHVPQIPEERDFELWRMLPQKNRDEDATGELEDFVLCFQEVTDLLLCLIDRWTDILDPDVAAEAFLDCMLADLGNPFEFDLDENDKRKLIRILVDIYLQKGTAVGIINVVRFFLGIEVTITSFSSEGWDLGIDELGDSVTDGTAILGPGTSFGLYSFEIESPVVLTAEQREQITDIANYMKPAHTHLVGIVEPTIPTVIDHLELGLSELGGDEWLLH